VQTAALPYKKSLVEDFFQDLCGVNITESNQLTQNMSWLTRNTQWPCKSVYIAKVQTVIQF
jgi:hypothetical protein